MNPASSKPGSKDEKKPPRPAGGYLHRDSKPSLPTLAVEPAPKRAVSRRKPETRNPMRDFYAANIKRLVLNVGAMVLVLFVVYQVAKRAAVPKPHSIPKQAVKTQPAPLTPEGEPDLVGADIGPVSKGEIIRSAVDMVKEGMLLEAEGQLDQALTKYQTAARVCPPVPDAMRLIARIHASRGEYDLAIHALERALEQESDRIDLQTELGRCLLEAGRIPPAYEILKKALEQDPEYSPAYLPYSRCLALRGRAEDGRRLLIHYLDQTPEDVEAHYHLAMMAASEKDFESALNSLQTAIALSPGRADLYREAAAAAALLGRFDEALANLQQAEQHGDPADVLKAVSQPAFEGLRATESGREYAKQLIARVRKTQVEAVDPGLNPSP